MSSRVKGEKESSLRWTKFLMRYFDGRFAADEAFTWHMLNFMQRHLNNRIAPTFLKQFFFEKNETIETLKEKIENNDFTFVSKLQNFASTNIRGSDGWWRNRKHELDSWIAYHLKERHGPPTLFMTFSCAEYWWSDLHKFLLHMCENTPDYERAKKLCDKDFTNDDEKRKIKNDLLDKYTARVQEFFHHRMDNWLETVGTMVFNINHYYLRFEFAKGRGQIHAHMVAITSDNAFLVPFFDSYVTKNDLEGGVQVYTDYAEQQLGLTAVRPKVCETEEVPTHPLQDSFTSCKSCQNDIVGLVRDAHMHKCNNYCLRAYTK